VRAYSLFVVFFEILTWCDPFVGSEEETPSKTNGTARSDELQLSVSKSSADATMGSSKLRISTSSNHCNCRSKNSKNTTPRRSTPRKHAPSKSRHHTADTNTKPRGANASFLTSADYSFPVAQARLVSALTDARPFEPYWEGQSFVDLGGRGLESVARLGEWVGGVEGLKL
jgi:protein NUD1